MMPEALVTATRDFRAGTIDEETYLKRLEGRRPYRARPKAGPDSEGHQRLLCPAAAGAPTARCALKPISEQSDGRTRVRVRPSEELTANPPACCRQESITVPPEAGAKFGQDLAYAGPEFRRTYATLRNSVEGMNGFVKDAAYEGLGVSQRRRVRGVAA